MLYGHFAESKSRLAEGEEWVVELPEDDDAPMKVPVDISHGHFGKGPEEEDAAVRAVRSHGAVQLLRLHEDEFEFDRVKRPPNIIGACTT